MTIDEHIRRIGEAKKHESLSEIESATEALRTSRNDYKAELTSITLSPSEYMDYCSTTEERNTFEYTTDEDETMYDALGHYLERLQEQRERHGASNDTTVLYAPGTNSSSVYGDASGQEAESAPFKCSIPEIPTVESDADDDDGNVLTPELAEDGLRGNLDTSLLRLRFNA